VANGIKTIIAEMITAAPEWAFRRYAHARYETAAGVGESGMSGSCVTGGFRGCAWITTTTGPPRKPSCGPW